jgi:hypothetical protein
VSFHTGEHLDDGADPDFHFLLFSFESNKEYSGSSGWNIDSFLACRIGTNAFEIYAGCSHRALTIASSSGQTQLAARFYNRPKVLEFFKKWGHILTN